MSADDTLWTDPIASSRAAFTLPYKADDARNETEADFADDAAVETYQRAWNECHGRIQATLSSLHDASLDQIVAFVRAPKDGGDSLYIALSGRALLRTGLIVGASPGSSSLLYASLVRQLTWPSSANQPAQRSSSLVSRLASRDCSNIKNALRSLIGGFIGSDIEIEADDEGDEEDQHAGGPATLKSALFVPEDMLNLQAWYEHRFGKKDSDNAPTLVILLEDLEAMDGKVLTQMIDTLSHYVDSLPLVFLVGIATTVDALYSLLSRKTANKLEASNFFVDPGVSVFNALVRGVFVDSQPPLSLAPKLYTEMWRTFEDLHHSVDATISFIQVVYMNHLISQPFASFTRPASMTPPSASLDALRALPSVVSTPDLASVILNPSASSADILSEVETCRRAVSLWHAERSAAFEALLATMDFWEKRKPLETMLAMVLGEGGEKGLAKMVDDLCSFVLQASPSKLPLFLSFLLDRLSAFLAFPPSLSTDLSDFISAQQGALEPILDAPRPPGRSTLFNSNIAGGLALPGMGVGESAASDLDKQFSKVAKETAEGLKSRLKRALRPCTDLLLHEVWFANDTTVMKRFHPTPLPSLFRTLSRLDPFSDPSYQPEPSEPPPIMHDLAIAYRTYAETHPSGRLANLGEWWGGFELQAADEPEQSDEAGEGAANGSKGKQARERKRRRNGEEGDDADEDDDRSESEDEDEGPARRKQARFLRAIGDLAHLGFIHPTTYKPEHVLKSVY
ncbi:origin recognition complex subunit 3 [Rhodotorula toruloides]|uniref:Origin recognition complex subunit 3 n=1 Tax=Rhodotorula toruloides TaxID=5286 RepID=A0A511KGM2_RHOTO|nr:origin recognition complex subunit 3 [Rhodotorula toruloides]